MDCPADNDGNLIYVTATHGRRGIGVIQPQSGLDYPFVAPSDDIRYLLADLDVAVDDPGRYQPTEIPFTAPFRVKYLYGVGCVENEEPAEFLTPAHAADIVICDAVGRTVFDSTAPDTVYTEQTWGAHYQILRWQNNSGHCSVVVHTAWPPDDDERRHYDKYLTPQNGTLDSRAVYILPKRVKSLRVTDAAALSDVNNADKITGAVVFTNGFNTELAPSPASANFVNATNVTISAAAGSGFGKYPSCTDNADSGDPAEATPITKINGVAIDATGDFLISGEGCLWAHRPAFISGTMVLPRTDEHLEIGAGCAPCCECQDYVDLGLKINQYRSQYANIGNRVNEVKQIHEQNIQRWLDQRNCGINHPLRLLMVAQRCPYMDIVCMVCNPCTECLYVTELVLDLTPTIAATAELVTGYTALFAPNINGRPTAINRELNGATTTFRIPFPIVRSGDSSYIRFRVKFSVANEYAVTGALRATLTDGTPVLTGCVTDESRQLSLAAATQALYCDADGNTNLP